MSHRPATAAVCACLCVSLGVGVRVNFKKYERSHVYYGQKCNSSIVVSFHAATKHIFPFDMLVLPLPLQLVFCLISVCDNGPKVCVYCYSLSVSSIFFSCDLWIMLFAVLIPVIIHQLPSWKGCLTYCI